MLRNNSFANNFAYLYGDNFTSYPHSLEPISEEDKLELDAMHS